MKIDVVISVNDASTPIVIQVDIGGHPPIPLRPPPLLLSVFAQFTIFSSFFFGSWTFKAILRP
jgi:hypothetical protein